jgi:hypothetical protein
VKYLLGFLQRKKSVRSDGAIGNNFRFNSSNDWKARSLRVEAWLEIAMMGLEIMMELTIYCKIALETCVLYCILTHAQDASLSVGDISRQGLILVSNLFRRPRPFKGNLQPYIGNESPRGSDTVVRTVSSSPHSLICYAECTCTGVVQPCCRRSRASIQLLTLKAGFA